MQVVYGKNCLLSAKNQMPSTRPRDGKANLAFPFRDRSEKELCTTSRNVCTELIPYVRKYTNIVAVKINKF